MNINQQPTLEEVRNDLIAILYGIAATLDIQVREGAGAAMLCLPEGTPINNWPRYADFDLSQFSFDSDLNEIYRYAFHGEVGTRGRIGICDDSEEGNLGRLRSIEEIAGYGQFSRNMHDFEDENVGPEPAYYHALSLMVKLASARFALDSNRTISLSDIAMLAKINERSIRNALYAEGSAMLAAYRGEEGELIVDCSEALRWLKGRHNFQETVQIGSLQTNMPSQLSREELMPFLKSRFDAFYNGGYGNTDEEAADSNFANAAMMIGWTQERLHETLTQPLDALSPDDCPLISRLLYLDTAWLTEQVLRARFPGAMQELKPTAGFQKTTASPLDEAAGTIDITLKDAGIRNGYFDIERRYADRFFPSDSFGSRNGDQPGKTFSLIHDSKGSPYETDLRVKSQALVSPRKRFSAYFTAHSAKAGDVIRIKRTGDRTYELIFMPK